MLKVYIMQITFNDLINKIRNLSLDEKIEIKEIIEKSIIDERRKEIQKHYLESKKDYNNGKLQFSKNISKLKKMIG